MNNKQKKRISGVIIAIVLIFVFWISGRQNTALTMEASMSIGLFLAAIVLWICDVFPMAISAALIVCLYPLFGIMTFKDAIGSFSSSSVIFIFGTFAITAAMKGTSMPLRITAACVKVTKGDAGKLILVFCLVSGIMSGIMSSSAVCVMFWAIALTILDTMKEDSGKLNLGKALAIVLPVACGMGGFITPAGTPGNILLIDFMASCGINISFVQWTIIGFPIALIGLIVFGFWSRYVFKVEDITEESQEKLCIEAEQIMSWSSKDIKTIVIIVLMLFMWIMGSWIEFFNTATVAVIGMVLMFLPGIDILSWSELKDECNTNILLMIGLAPIIANTLSTSGALNYLVETVFHKVSFQNMNPLIFLVMFSTVICIMRAFIPTPTAVVSLLGPLAYSVSSVSTLNAAAVLMIVGFWSAAAMLLIYTEPIYYFTFGHGYYTQKDVLKCGWLPCIVMAVVTSILCPVLVSVAGI